MSKRLCQEPDNRPSLPASHCEHAGARALFFPPLRPRRHDRQHGEAVHTSDTLAASLSGHCRVVEGEKSRGRMCCRHLANERRPAADANRLACFDATAPQRNRSRQQRMIFRRRAAEDQKRDVARSAFRRRARLPCCRGRSPAPSAGFAGCWRSRLFFRIETEL
jgi:hypothetical protein